MYTEGRVESIKFYINFEEGLLLKDFTKLLDNLNKFYESLTILTASERQIYNLVESYERYYEQSFSIKAKNHPFPKVKRTLSKNIEPLAIRQFYAGSIWIELMTNPMVTDLVETIISTTNTILLEQLIRHTIEERFRKNEVNPNIKERIIQDCTDDIGTKLGKIYDVLKDEKYAEVKLKGRNGTDIELKIHKKDTPEI